MSDHSAPSSEPTDLDLARQASRRARGGQARQMNFRDEGYTRLAAPTETSAGAAAPAPELPPRPSSDAGWQAVVQWCAAATEGSAAFLMSNEGLTIAEVGDSVSADAVGPRLMLAFDHGRLVLDAEGAARDVGGALHFRRDNHWMTGLRIPAADGWLTLGVVTSNPPPPAVQAKLRQVVEGHLEAQKTR